VRVCVCEREREEKREADREIDKDLPCVREIDRERMSERDR
jgi:hypothetical protein